MNNARPIKKRRKQAVKPEITTVERRFALYRAGKTQRDLARELNVSPAAVSGVISGLYTSAQIAKRLSEITGIELTQLYPDGRYNITKKGTKQ